MQDRQVTNLNVILITLLTYIISCFGLTTTIYAQTSALSFVEAYNACSTEAHNLVKTECRYGAVFEGFYQQCMSEYGYSEDSEHAPNNYDHYMQAYNYCRSTADSSTQTQCRYGERFNAYYVQCLGRYGFDANGNPLTSENTLRTQPTSPNNSNPENEDEFEFSF